MNLVMTMPVRNGQNLIEDNIRYHYAKGVDAFVITLHNCTDNTASIVSSLAKTIPISVTVLQTNIIELAKVRTKMASIAITDFKADWIINNDIDEVWRSEQSLKDIFVKETEYNTLYANRYNVLPFSEINIDFECYPIKQFNYVVGHPIKLNKEQPFTNITGRDYLLRTVNGKAASRTEGLNHIDIGSHEINIENRQSKISTEITILHYFLSTREAFLSETMNHVGDMLRDPNRLDKQGWHLRLLQFLKQNNMLEKFTSELFVDIDVIEEFLADDLVYKDYYVSNFLGKLYAHSKL